MLVMSDMDEKLISNIKVNWLDISVQMIYMSDMYNFFNYIYKNMNQNLNMKNQHLLTKKDLLKDNDEGFLPLPEICKNIRTKTNFRHSRLFPSLKEFYIYEPSMGIYQKYDDNGFRSMMGKVFTSLNIEVDYNLINNICNNFKVGPLSYPMDQIEVDETRIAFINGVLNLISGQFYPHSPEWFIISQLSFNYDPYKVPGEIFMKYLEHVSNYSEERQLLLRSFLKILIMKYHETQTFLYIQGQAGTGKSVLGHLASALVGNNGTVITSLRSLNNDSFEVYNLKDKQLIIISDTEFYSGDLSILKQAVGGDPLKGRIKFVQGGKDLYTKGLVIIIGNYGFGSQDTSGALERRIRIFKADNKVTQRIPLIYRKNNSWGGPLSNELPGIFNWVYGLDMETAIKVIQEPQIMLPGITLESKEELRSLNPIRTWVEEDLEKGQGSYVGYKTFNKDTKALVEVQRRGLLYPSYYSFCEKRGLIALNHKLFSGELVNILQSEGYKVKRIRRTEGSYIEGVQLKQASFDRDRSYGGPIIWKDTLPSLSLKDDKPSTVSPFKDGLNTVDNNKAIDRSYEKDIYEEYMGIISKRTEEKKRLNSFIKNNPPSIDFLVDTYFKDVSNPSELYRDSVTKVFNHGINIVTKYGAIPYNYKKMGISPRLIPVNYGDTLNNTKKILRDKVLSIMNCSMDTHTIVDFDLKSCYTSILLGLYPKPMMAVQRAIEGIGLWNSIKEEFIQRGKESVYNKRAVKVCVYSSFFLGGTKAMMEGIMDNIRKDTGLTKGEWRSSGDLYETSYKLAQEVTGEMMNSSVILDFQSIAQDIKKQYIDDQFEGPSGHVYRVSEENFRNVYPNFLQSYEITLLAVSTNRVIRKYPDVQVIGHYHDGNVLFIPNNIVNEVVDSYKSEVENLGKEIGLHYKQSLEVKLC
jgi:phage/plasmid-associated DNA primase